MKYDIEKLKKGDIRKLNKFVSPEVANLIHKTWKHNLTCSFISYFIERSKEK